MPTQCPCCDSGNTSIVDSVIHPPSPKVAGVPIDLGPHPYYLYVCDECGLYFKNPPISAVLLNACYEASPDDNWKKPTNPRRRRFDVFKTLLEKHSPGNRILDVGCFDGTILKFLGDRWIRFGVEPSLAATKKATESGVTVLSRFLDDLPPECSKFDAIILIDVAEHLPSPKPFFSRLATLLNKDGILLILTGNADHWTFRMQKGRYWYVSLPEHLLFWTPKAFQTLLRPAGLSLIHQQKISHIRTSLWRRVRDTLRNIANHFFYLLLKRFSKNQGHGMRPAPLWISASDHSLLVFKKSTDC